MYLCSRPVAALRRSLQDLTSFPRLFFTTTASSYSFCSLVTASWRPGKSASVNSTSGSGVATFKIKNITNVDSDTPIKTNAGLAIKNSQRDWKFAIQCECNFHKFPCLCKLQCQWKMSRKGNWLNCCTIKFKLRWVLKFRSVWEIVNTRASCDNIVSLFALISIISIYYKPRRFKTPLKNVK